MRAIGTGAFTAQPRSREDLPRVADAVGVKSGPYPGHHGEVLWTEHLQHRARLVTTHAVLTGDRPALVDAQLDDRRREVLGPLGLARHRAVVEHERVQV